MTEYLQKNKSALSKRPELSAALYQYEKSEAESERLYLKEETARDGNQILTATIQGEHLRFNSAYRPLTEAVTWAEQFNFENRNTVAIVFGFCNGYCVRELCRRKKIDSRILVYEPSPELFLHVMKYYDISELLLTQEFELIVNELNPLRLFEALEAYTSWTNGESQIVCEHPQYRKAFPKAASYFYEMIRRNNVRIFTDRNTEMHFGMTIVNNTMKNFPLLYGAASLAELKKIYPPDLPMIIISAGPSLDSNVDELKRLPGREVDQDNGVCRGAFLLATDAALPVLAAHGIRPDAAITIDAEKSLRCFAEECSRKVPLLCEIQSTSEILSNQNGQLIFLHSQPYFRELCSRLGAELPVYPLGGSVATAAFATAEYLGARRIILIGQDLAYKGNVSHAGGEVHTILGEEKGICYLEGIDGEQVKSRHDWKAYLAWFEEAILRSKEKTEVIDATEGGALIRGSSVMSLKEAVERFCSNNKDNSISGWNGNLPEIFQDSKRSKEILSDYLKNGLRELKILIPKSEEISKKCEMSARMLRENVATEEQTEIRKQTEHYNETVNEMTIYPLIDAGIRNKTIPYIQQEGRKNQNAEDELRIFLEGYAEIHKAISNVAGELQKQLIGICADMLGTKGLQNGENQ